MNPSGHARPQIPSSTYRFQFHRDFRFTDATILLPYLHQLGITACYSSPYMKANPGSTHGYDICDHNQLNPEIGSAADYAAFTAGLAAQGLGQLVDFVPNHMGVNPRINPWWRAVLENGRCSPYATFFDIDWEPIKPELRNKVLLPLVGDQYGAVLERGELQLDYVDGAFVLRYFDHELPVNPRPAAMVLRHQLATLQQRLGDNDPNLREYLSIITALDHLPPDTDTDPARIAERQRETAVTQERLARLYDGAPPIRQHVADSLRAFNGIAGQAASFDLLHTLLEAQAYRLAYWRTAADEINYRRFFDINTLAGVRMEDPVVFVATHVLLLQLLRQGTVTGVRLDHIDGLFDPLEYLVRLRGAADDGTPTDGPYIVVEKILSAGESLNRQWPIDGTSGYDFLNDVNGLFVDVGNARRMLRVYQRFSKRRTPFADVVYESKRLIMQTSLASELNLLAHALNRLSEADRRTRDFTLNALRVALREVVACFPVYRTYVSPSGCSDTDTQTIDAALQRVRRRNPTMESSIFAFLRSVLLPDTAAVSATEYQRRVEFAMKFQQYTGPVQAKGLEDTAFYRYGVLLSLNEVGGDPSRFGRTPAEFHAANRQRQEHWPHTLLATATHDTKRGEDARARLNVLSEIPDEWSRHVFRWTRSNAGNRTLVDGQPAPDRNDEYFFYQTLLAIWPPGATAPGPHLVDRLRQYMLKAVREAKVHTSWIIENSAYEAAVSRFVERTLHGRSARRFLPSFLALQARIAHFGMINSLAQLVLKIVCPGVPDFYQGTELWDLSLVDPDNRRPVDYAVRQHLLDELRPMLAEGDRTAAVADLLAHWQDGRIKLFLTVAALRLRHHRRDLFLSGTYEPLSLSGDKAEQVCAILRRAGEHAVIAVVPRLCTRLVEESRLPIGADVWGDLRIELVPGAPSTYRDLFTGATVSPRLAGEHVELAVAEVLRSCPVALLVAE